MEDGQLVLKIKINDKLVSSVLDHVSKQVNEQEEQTEKLAYSLEDIVRTLNLDVFAGKGIEQLKQSFIEGFDYVDVIESFDRTMTAITGSSEAAAVALDKTKQAVSGTAFGFDTATKAVQSLVTHGTDIHKATDYIEIWGDAVAFYGNGSREQFSEVTDSLVSMLSTNEASMDQINRLYDVGINAPEMYADATGKSVEQVKKELEDGTISAEEFVEVISKSMKEGSDSFVSIEGAAKEVGVTWENVFDIIRDSVTRGATEIIQSIDEMLTSNGLPDMRTMMVEFGLAFENTLNSVSEALPPLIERLKQIYTALEPWLPLLGSIAVGVGSVVVGIGAFNSVAGYIKNIQKAFALLNGTIWLNPITWLVAAIIAAAVLVYIYWEPISQFFIDLWNSIVEVAIGIWDRIVETWNEVIESIYSIFDPLIDFYMQLWESIFDGTSQIWENIMEYFSETWENIKTIASAAWELIKNVILGPILLLINLLQGDLDEFAENLFAIWENIKDAATTIWETIKEQILLYVQLVIDQVSILWDGLKSYLIGLWDSVLSVASNIWEKIKSNINERTQAIQLLLREIWDAIVLNIFRKLADIWDEVKKKFSDVKDAVKERMEDVKNTIRDIWDDAVSFLTNVDLKDIGEEMIQGLINGIGGMASNVFSKVNEIAEGIKGKIKSALSIFSPSRWMRDVIGVNLMKGFEVGVEKEKGSVIRKSAEAAEWMKPDINDFKNHLRGLAIPLGRLTGLSSLNLVANGATQNEMNTSSAYEKQPAVINVNVGSKKIASEIIDDITKLQERNKSRQQRVPSQRGAFV
ncbi:phage tail protein [Alkalihalobacillus hemicellulosilyticus]|uniref:Phage tail length tape-measure protein n=1 Tax=Halalkalibacter hemicellulosilyticusJCM 9152 TaxID=1236971 RepID=W4QKT1_9BACI|nr:tape measure protein [Halalkalibacter hemicellulosilyticus]GAE31924.1 phage tail length tape-measure protein [Halalkalibacter hemicellulosilyticusJCM 9152]